MNSLFRQYSNSYIDYLIIWGAHLFTESLQMIQHCGSYMDWSGASQLAVVYKKVEGSLIPTWYQRTVLCTLLRLFLCKRCTDKHQLVHDRYVYSRLIGWLVGLLHCSREGVTCTPADEDISTDHPVPYWREPWDVDMDEESSLSACMCFPSLCAGLVPGCLLVVKYVGDS